MRKNKKYFLLIVFLALILCVGREAGYAYSSEGYPTECTWVGEAGNIILNEISLNLDEGSYELLLTYDNTTNSENEIRIVDMQHVDKNNNRGVTVASESVDAGSGEIKIPFTIEQGSGEIRLGADAEILISGWKVVLVRDNYLDNYLLFFILVLLAYFVFLKMDWKNPQYIYILLGIAVLISLPFLGTPLMGSVTHDLRFHLSRIRGIAEGIASGQFPVRLNVDMNGGYGFASEMMYPNLFIYIPAILYLMGVALIASYKFFVLLINIGTAVTGYYSFSRLLKSNRAGAVCAFLYMVNPYRLNNIFLRGAVGEVLAQIFFPLLLYALIEVVYWNYKKWWLLVISVTGILQSHILSLEYSALLAFVFLAISWKQFICRDGIKRIGACFKAAGMIIVTNLWFLVPFFDQFRQGYVLVNDQRSVGMHAVYLYQMFFSFFHVSGSDIPDGLSGEMPLTIGIVLLLGSILFLYLAFGKKVIEKYNCQIGKICLFAGAAMCYMSSELFPWTFLEKNCKSVYSILAKIQFPWRMLCYAVLFLCIVTTIVIIYMAENGKKEIAAAMLFMSAFLMLECMDGYLTDGEVLAVNRSQYIAAGTYVDYYRSDFPVNDWEKIGSEAGQIMIDGDSNIKIEQYEKNGVDLQFHFSEKDTSDVLSLQLPLYNYYLHEVMLNDQLLETATGVDGRISIVLPEGVSEGTISAKYVGRIIYKVSDWISVFGTAGVILILVRRKKQHV